LRTLRGEPHGHCGDAAAGQEDGQGHAIPFVVDDM